MLPRLKRRGTHYAYNNELSSVPMVRRVKQLKVLSRVKRDYHTHEDRRRSRRRHDFGDEIRRHRRRRKRMTKFNIEQGPNDPLYGNMWYINPG